MGGEEKREGKKGGRARARARAREETGGGRASCGGQARRRKGWRAPRGGAPSFAARPPAGAPGAPRPASSVTAPPCARAPGEAVVGDAGDAAPVGARRAGERAAVGACGRGEPRARGPRGGRGRGAPRGRAVEGPLCWRSGAGWSTRVSAQESNLQPRGEGPLALPLSYHWRYRTALRGRGRTTDARAARARRAPSSTSVPVPPSTAGRRGPCHDAEPRGWPPTGRLAKIRRQGPGRRARRGPPRSRRRRSRGGSNSSVPGGAVRCDRRRERRRGRAEARRRVRPGIERPEPEVPQRSPEAWSPLARREEATHAAHDGRRATQPAATRARTWRVDFWRATLDRRGPCNAA